MAATGPRRTRTSPDRSRQQSGRGRRRLRVRGPESHDARLRRPLRVHAWRVGGRAPNESRVAAIRVCNHVQDAPVYGAKLPALRGATAATARRKARPPTRAEGREAHRMRQDYVHGHHRRERQRLQDQAGALVDLLHGDTKYPKGSRVLEAGCGVGAQTVTLARRSPGAAFVSVDVSAASLAAARRAVDQARPGQRRVPARGHSRLAVRRGVVRPRLRLLRARASLPPGARARAASAGAEAGWHAHRYRGRSRLGIFPSRQRRRARRDSVPGGAASQGRRECASWAGRSIR